MQIFSNTYLNISKSNLQGCDVNIIIVTDDIRELLERNEFDFITLVKDLVKYCAINYNFLNS